MIHIAIQKWVLFLGSSVPASSPSIDGTFPYHNHEYSRKETLDSTSSNENAIAKVPLNRSVTESSGS